MHASFVRTPAAALARLGATAAAALAIGVVVAPRAAEAKVIGTSVEYKHGSAVCEGYLAYDDATTAKRPGVLVVHEWKGLDTYAKGRADQLAALGYVAFAADMYGKGVRATTHEEAAALSGLYRKDRSLMRARATAALDVLRADARVDASRVAAIGYCFGGTTVLELARAGADLRGVASFHGALDTPSPAAAGSVKAKVLVFHGAEDPHVSREKVAGFQDEMRAAKADWQLVLLGGAVHSFTVPHAGTDPSTGLAYDERADRRSWAMLQLFFAEVFGG